MALLCWIELNCGIILENAYIKIEDIGGNKLIQNMRINFYNTKEDYLANKPAVDYEQENFVPDLSENAPNFIKQGYEHLKTLDRYKNAVNCQDLNGNVMDSPDGKTSQ